MITADTLKTLTTFTAKGLAGALANSGYKGWEIKTAKFVGITNAGQFCYTITYDDRNGLGEETGKVFLTYDHANGKVSADY